MRCVALMLPALAVLVSAEASAQGFPGSATDLETVLLGRGVAPLHSRGRWESGPTGLRQLAPPGVGESVSILAAANARLDDGMVRARFELGKRAEVTLLLRATWPAPAGPAARGKGGNKNIDGEPALEQLTALGVSFESNLVRLIGTRGGVSRPLGSDQSVPGLFERRGIEVVVFLVGPLVTATVYDLDSLTPLATIAGRDEGSTSGGLGLRGGARLDDTTRLVHLSILPARTAWSADPASDFGPLRLAWLRWRDAWNVETLPGDLVDLRPGFPTDELLLRTTPVGIERIRRQNAELLEVTDAVGWRWLDARMRQRRALGPASEAAAFAPGFGFRDAAMLEATLRQLAARHPDLARLESVGTSGEGRPIWALSISRQLDAPGLPAVLVSGAHHGNELLSVEHALDAAVTLLEDGPNDPVLATLLDQLRFVCVPLVNPDGLQAFVELSTFAGRKNRLDTDEDGRRGIDEGVDLNRNYPFAWGSLGERGSRSLRLHPWFRGPGPASEPEVRAMMSLADREVFTGAVSFHTYAASVLSPYTIDGVASPSPDEAWPLAEAMADAAGVQVNGRRIKARRKLYPVDGTDQDWLRHAHGTLAFIVEGPLHNDKDVELTRSAVLGTRPTWITLARRIVEGPTARLRIRDRQGEPVVARVEVVEAPTNAGERWLSRARDGTFVRLLAAPGTFTFKVSAPGRRPVVRKATIGAGITDVVITM